MGHDHLIYSLPSLFIRPNARLLFFEKVVPRGRSKDPPESEPRAWDLRVLQGSSTQFSGSDVHNSTSALHFTIWATLTVLERSFFLDLDQKRM